MTRSIVRPLVIGVMTLAGMVNLSPAPAAATTVYAFNPNATVWPFDGTDTPVGNGLNFRGGDVCTRAGAIEVEDGFPPAFSGTMGMVAETTLSGGGSPTHLVTVAIDIDSTLAASGGDFVVDAEVEAVAVFRDLTSSCQGASGTPDCTLSATGINLTGVLEPHANDLESLGTAPSDGPAPDGDHADLEGGNDLFSTSVAGSGCGLLTSADGGRVEVALELDEFVG